MDNGDVCIKNDERTHTHVFGFGMGQMFSLYVFSPVTSYLATHIPS